MYTLHYDHSHKTAVPTELHRCAVCGRGFLTRSGRAKSPPPAEGGLRTETPIRRRQIRPRKASNTNVSRTALPVGQYDFPRTQRKQVLSVYIDAKKGAPS